MRISQNLILVPVLVQVALTFAVMFMMGFARSRSMRSRRQQMQDMALATADDWTEEAAKCANSFKNQFELPVLFHVCCLFALVTRNVDAVLFSLAALFALSRIAHAAIHIGPNIVAWRFSAYLVGALLLMVMWALLGWRVAVQGW
ncbi:MAG: MAPEG family protein [Hyphomicrobiaceae bacterium]